MGGRGYNPRAATMRDVLTREDVEWVGEIPDLPALDEPRAAALAEILDRIDGQVVRHVDAETN